MEVVNRWRASNFERRAVEDVLAEDVEWVVPSGGGVTTLRAGVSPALVECSGGPFELIFAHVNEVAERASSIAHAR
jgi:hypothetical protein